MEISRRCFIKSTIGAGVTHTPAQDDIVGKVFKGDGPKVLWKWSKEAYHYNTKGKVALCNTCPHMCTLEPGDRGICRSKVNVDGRLFSLSYGNPSAVHVDPIEKKPLFHFYPKARILSIGIAGCNLRCLNCQNWQISQKRPEDLSFDELSPMDAVNVALKNKIGHIAYTYSEPISFYEYIYDTSMLAREKGIKTSLISNGYVNQTPLRMLSQYLDAANINLKSFSDATYRRLNGGRLDPVLNTLKILKEEGVWLEITTLLVPTYVEDMDMIKRMCQWILKELGPDCPHHFLRFFPQYKLTRLPPTPIDLMEKAREVALKEGLKYVYLGNVPGHKACHTYCPNCKRTLVERNGYLVDIKGLRQGHCTFCNEPIAGRWET